MKYWRNQALNSGDIHYLLAHVEDSTRLFKTDVKNDGSLALEMAAFVKTGGMVLSGHCGPISDRLSMEPAA